MRKFRLLRYLTYSGLMIIGFVEFLKINRMQEEVHELYKNKRW